MVWRDVFLPLFPFSPPPVFLLSLPVMSIPVLMRLKTENPSPFFLFPFPFASHVFPFFPSSSLPFQEEEEIDANDDRTNRNLCTSLLFSFFFPFPLPPFAFLLRILFQLVYHKEDGGTEQNWALAPSFLFFPPPFFRSPKVFLKHVLPL